VEQVATALAMQIAQHFSRGQDPAAVRGGLSGAARRRLQSLWRDRLADAPGVDEMAALVGLSASHFQRAFRETFGRSPWQHLLALRLEAARQQLLGGGSVSTVAAALGFADQSHFTRHFRRHFGVTPGRVARAAAGMDR
jgi:AraC-like DNA-binding protein